MISYRFKRRAFLTAVSGGVGLKILLRNMEAAAQTTKSPAKLLVAHWPVGIVAGANDALWKPSSGSIGGSMGLQPFADNNLGADMTVLRGLRTPVGAGGSHEGGTPALVSGVACPGTRSGEQESDDGYSGGPSIEQYLLGQVAALKSPGSAYSYKNAGCDTRTDFGEISTKCLSYSVMKQKVAAYNGNGSEQENIPYLPNLSPLNMYNDLFQNFVPTANYVDNGNGFAAAAPAADATLTNLATRRSVLDFAAQELNALRAMGPADARMKLDNHYNAVLAMENSLTDSINRGYPNPTGTGGGGGNMGMGGSAGGSSGGRGGAGGSTGGVGGRGGTTGTGGRGGAGGASGGTSGTTGTGGTGGSGTMGCKTKPTAPQNVMGAMDQTKGLGNPYGTNGNIGQNDDSSNMSAVGAAHFAVLKAAFICDIIRCGTFLWAPGTNHTGFKLYPNSSTIYMHHPTSHHTSTNASESGSSVSALSNDCQFLFAVQQWFFARTAENLKDWKNSIDGYGNSLLDYTVVPYLTEVRANGHERDNMPGMIIGGKALGYKHNVYQTGSMSINQYWGTIAQAFGVTSFGAPLGTPISGLWTKPA
ncbi:MAG TPA: DUF1552 domain-containing protein [Polyangia bacterium]